MQSFTFLQQINNKIYQVYKTTFKIQNTFKNKFYQTFN